MSFNKHSELAGAHAFLSPSSYHWLNYDEDDLRKRFVTKQAAAHGSRLHALAFELISLKQRLPKSTKTLNHYVNDCIGHRMVPEQVLFFSPNCFGTADAINLEDVPGDPLPTLRIFDLKTGESPTSYKQLIVYAALFCLEYGYKPNELLYDLRIYQSDDVQYFEVDFKDIVHAIDRIVTFDRILNQLQEEAVR